MPRRTAYRVPNDVLSDQAAKIAALYADDSTSAKEKLAGVGLDAASFENVAALGTQLMELEQGQEIQKDTAAAEQSQATEAVQAVLRWRLDDALPRARVAFEDDPRSVHFRSGKLRSHRPSAVAREARLLIAAIRRFKDTAEAKSIGLDASVADRGQELLEALRKEDTESEVADANQREATATLRELEEDLSAELAEIEKRAAIAFPSGSAQRSRYRMNVIREYVARQHSGGAIDPSASVEVPDPAPEAPADL